jgi:RNA polymerase sigma-70 factor (sigma-E family)
VTIVSTSAEPAPGADPARDLGAPLRWTPDEAVEHLYAAHYRQLVRLSVLLVRDQETAEEVVQDAFVALHGKWRGLRDPHLGLAYLRQSVVNRSRSVLRHRAVELRHLSTAAAQQAAAPPWLPGADEAVVRRAGRAAVLDALQQLSTRQREVLVLRYYLDLDEAGIADALGISRGAVKSHASRAAAALRTLLELDDDRP